MEARRFGSLAVAFALVGQAGCQLVLGVQSFEGCEVGTYSCEGATMVRCVSERGDVQTVANCGSAPLCETGKSRGACTTPACGPGSLDPATSAPFPLTRCAGGALEKCADDQQTYTSTACGARQCNPAASACFDLKVDAKEVTVAQYKKFVSDNPTVSVPKACTGNVRTPDAACLATADVCKGATCEETPQVCVDWCDAYEFCAAAGKRLCGKVGGGMVPLADASDPGQSEWMNACSAGGENAWVVGSTWDDLVQGQVCNGGVKARNPGTASVFPAGQLTACSSKVSAYANLYDLAGNVAEWEDSCERPAADTSSTFEDNCRVRGGSFASDKPKLRCDADRREKRSARLPDVGFRCCGP